MKELMEDFAPFAYFNLPSITSEHDSGVINAFNILFQEFLATLDSRNRKPWPDYIRDFGEEGGVAHVYFPDGFIHEHSKMFYFHQEKDDNLMRYTGVVIRNHTDQKHFTYGVLRIAKDFILFLQSKKIPFRLFLRNSNTLKDIEVYA